MREEILRDFLLGRVDSETFSEDLDNSIAMVGPNEAGVSIARLGDGAFHVTAEQLVRVCDAVSSGVVEPWKLEAVGFCLVASDYFQFEAADPDGGLVAKVIHRWAAPQVHYPLTVKTVAKARHLLVTGEDTFSAEDLRETPDKAWNVGRVSAIFQDKLH